MDRRIDDKSDSREIHRWAPRVIAIAALLTVLGFLASLVIIYWGDEYASAARNERSVPVPTTY